MFRTFTICRICCLSRFSAFLCRCFTTRSTASSISAEAEPNVGALWLREKLVLFLPAVYRCVSFFLFDLSHSEFQVRNDPRAEYDACRRTCRSGFRDRCRVNFRVDMIFFIYVLGVLRRHGIWHTASFCSRSIGASSSAKRRRRLRCMRVSRLRSFWEPSASTRPRLLSHTCGLLPRSLCEQAERNEIVTPTSFESGTAATTAGGKLLRYAMAST